MENQHHPSPEEASSEVVFPSLPIEHVGLIVGSLPHSETQKMRLVSRTMDEVSFVASWCSRPCRAVADPRRLSSVLQIYCL
jgi:hypothetical protein